MDVRRGRAKRIVVDHRLANSSPDKGVDMYIHKGIIVWVTADHSSSLFRAKFYVKLGGLARAMVHFCRGVSDEGAVTAIATPR